MMMTMVRGGWRCALVRGGWEISLPEPEATVIDYGARWSGTFFSFDAETSTLLGSGVHEGVQTNKVGSGRRCEMGGGWRARGKMIVGVRPEGVFRRDMGGGRV
jgi:hypothetical protein